MAYTTNLEAGDIDAALRYAVDMIGKGYGLTKTVSLSANSWSETTSAPDNSYGKYNNTITLTTDDHIKLDATPRVFALCASNSGFQRFELAYQYSYTDTDSTITVYSNVAMAVIIVIASLGDD